MRAIALTAIVALCTSCGNSTLQLNQTDGLKLVTGGFSGALYKTDTDGKNKSRVIDTTREGHTQAIKAAGGVVADENVILIYQIMAAAPNVFSKDFLRQRSKDELLRILGALKVND